MLTIPTPTSAVYCLFTNPMDTRYLAVYFYCIVVQYMHQFQIDKTLKPAEFLAIPLHFDTLHWRRDVSFLLTYPS
ncbi:hypothetical protein JZ751_026760 [Albula glossodonta]|uniref:Uncharacterized protein n=1 Tax=Albula glossodonta TaxID=121402 RepID=A0A8T2PE98_9TELE|nr:hypothetical protein JZ751_026760 [Albula glossodonta]